MSLSPYIWLILMVIAAVTVYALFVVLSTRHKKRSRVLRSLYINEEDSYEHDDGQTSTVRVMRDVLTLLGIDVVKLREKDYGKYGSAGLYTEASVTKFLFFRYLAQPFFFVIGVALLLLALTDKQSLGSVLNIMQMLIGVIVAIIGISGHTIVLDKIVTRRKERLTQDFPDAVDLLLICVESGMGLDAALARVARELQRSHPYVTGELERTKIELGLYGDRVQALQNLAERTDLQSYRSLVSALVQTEKYGTNLAATLRTLSHEYRQARLLKAEEKAARVGALLTLPVVIGVFFPVMGLIMAPPFIKLFGSGGLFDK